MRRKCECCGKRYNPDSSKQENCTDRFCQDCFYDLLADDVNADLRSEAECDLECEHWNPFSEVDDDHPSEADDEDGK